MTAASGGAAHAAAAAQRRREEEEEMTAPDADGPGPYEYKIRRSATAAFRKPDALRRALEEARAGWDLLEKFDNSRIRLRRHVKWREKDADLPQDPYRTRFAASEGVVAVCIVLGVFLGAPALVGLVLGVVFLIIKLVH
jgi:hypothetical protein